MLPGIALSLAIAAVATLIESLLPIHVIGAAVIAMFIGMSINSILKKKDGHRPSLILISKAYNNVSCAGFALEFSTCCGFGNANLTCVRVDKEDFA